MCSSSIFKPIQKITRSLLGISKPKAPPLPPETVEAKEETVSAIQEEEQKQKEERQKRLQDEVRVRARKKRRGGMGKRSLITGSGGGVGYFDETL